MIIAEYVQNTECYLLVLASRPTRVDIGRFPPGDGFLESACRLGKSDTLSIRGKWRPGGPIRVDKLRNETTGVTAKVK